MPTTEQKHADTFVFPDCHRTNPRKSTCVGGMADASNDGGRLLAEGLKRRQAKWAWR